MHEIPRTETDAQGCEPCARQVESTGKTDSCEGQTGHGQSESTSSCQDTAPEAPQGTCAGIVAGGGQQVPEEPPEAPSRTLPVAVVTSFGPQPFPVEEDGLEKVAEVRLGHPEDEQGHRTGTARFCARCLEYGDMTALDYRLPEGSLCEFHAAEKARRDATAQGFGTAPGDKAHLTILVEVFDELRRASEKFGPFRSTHEGWAVLREEVDELWDAVKANASGAILRAEALQVAAMAIRFVGDLCSRGGK